MIVGAIKSQIDAIWNDFWSGGLSNPLAVMEQISYLLFIKRLDEVQSLEEAKAAQLGRPIERRIFPEGKDPRGEPYEALRWKNFKAEESRAMFRTVDEHVFPFIRDRVAAEGGRLVEVIKVGGHGGRRPPGPAPRRLRAAQVRARGNPLRRPSAALSKSTPSPKRGVGWAPTQRAS